MRNHKSHVINGATLLLLLLLLAVILSLSHPKKAKAQATLVDIATDATDPSNLDDTEPSIAVNPVDSRQIVVVTFSENWGPSAAAPVWKSDDGGTTWRKVSQIPQPATGLCGPGDQKIAFDSTGNLFIAELGFTKTGVAGCPTGPTAPVSPQDFIFRQTGAADDLLTVGASYGDDQPHLDIDREATGSCFDRLYSPWLDFDAANERSTVSNSTTGGAAMTDVGAGNNTTFSNRTTRIALARDSKAYIIYKTREGTVAGGFENVHFRVNRSDDCGATWTGVGGAAGVSVHGTATVQTFFTTSFGNSAKGKVGRARSSDAWIAVDQGDGDVYAAYVNKDSSGFGQIYVARSVDDGVTWTTRRVTDGTHHSAYPEIAVANNGTVGVLYIDFDDSGTNTIFRHRFARSFDNGMSWSNQILQSMDPGPLANATGGWLWGDYEGLTAFGNQFYGVFTGQSIGRTTPQLDPIFFTETAQVITLNPCHLNPAICIDPASLKLGGLTLECPFRECIVIDPIPKNCLVKFECPGCPPNGLCPPWYNFYIQGLDNAWNIGLFDSKGNPASYYQFDTKEGIVISFQPSKENFIDGQIGDYFFAFQMSPNGETNVEYEVSMRLEQSDQPFNPER